MIDALREIVPKLPTETRGLVSDNLDVIEGEFQAETPDPNVVKAATTMIVYATKKVGSWAMEAAVEAGIHKLVDG